LILSHSYRKPVVFCSRTEMNTTKSSQTREHNSKVNLRILLAALWISHFLLWTFGDMLSLLQETSEPITETVFLIIAPSLAIAQTLMIVYSLRGEPKYVRYLNLVVPLAFLLFNIGYLAESSESWNYLLGSAYTVFNVLTIWNAWKWQLQGTSDDSMNTGSD
jgi:bacteriorhodopsin